MPRVNIKVERAYKDYWQPLKYKEQYMYLHQCDVCGKKFKSGGKWYDKYHVCDDCNNEIKRGECQGWYKFYMRGREETLILETKYCCQHCKNYFNKEFMCYVNDRPTCLSCWIKHESDNFDEQWESERRYYNHNRKLLKHQQDANENIDKKRKVSFEVYVKQNKSNVDIIQFMKDNDITLESEWELIDYWPIKDNTIALDILNKIKDIPNFISDETKYNSEYPRFMGFSSRDIRDFTFYDTLNRMYFTLLNYLDGTELRKDTPMKSVDYDYFVEYMKENNLTFESGHHLGFSDVDSNTKDSLIAILNVDGFIPDYSKDCKFYQYTIKSRELFVSATFYDALNRLYWNSIRSIVEDYDVQMYKHNNKIMDATYKMFLKDLDTGFSDKVKEIGEHLYKYVSSNVTIKDFTFDSSSVNKYDGYVTVSTENGLWELSKERTVYYSKEGDILISRGSNEWSKYHEYYYQNILPSNFKSGMEFFLDYLSIFIVVFSGVGIFTISYFQN